jgi:hypothetical protein
MIVGWLREVRVRFQPGKAIWSLPPSIDWRVGVKYSIKKTPFHPGTTSEHADKPLKLPTVRCAFSTRPPTNYQKTSHANLPDRFQNRLGILEIAL